MRELEATPWGSRIADRIRAGDVELRVVAELSPGYAAAAGPEVIWLAFRPSAAEMAGSIIHEGTHNLDPAIATYGTPESQSSRLRCRYQRLRPSTSTAGSGAYRPTTRPSGPTGTPMTPSTSRPGTREPRTSPRTRPWSRRCAASPSAMPWTPAQERALADRAIKAVEGILEDIAGEPLVGVDIGSFEDVPTSPGTSRFAHDTTSPDRHTPSTPPSWSGCGLRSKSSRAVRPGQGGRRAPARLRGIPAG